MSYLLDALRLLLCICSFIFTTNGMISAADCSAETQGDELNFLSSPFYSLQRATVREKHKAPFRNWRSFLTREKRSLRDRGSTDGAMALDKTSSTVTDAGEQMHDEFRGSSNAKRQIGNVWYVTPSLLDPRKKNRLHPPVRWDLASKGPVIAVPVLDEPDQLRDLIFSIDMPIAKLAIVWNKFPGDATSSIHKRIGDVIAEAKGALGDQFLHVHKSVGNLGFGGSYNHMWRDPGLAHFKWWVCASSDIAFGTGALASLTQHFTSPIAANKLISMVSGFAFFAISRRFFQEVGYFDENIYPAYLEDCDMMVRVKLLHGDDGKVWEHFSNIPYQHGVAVSRSVASPYDIAKRMDVAVYNIQQYYSVKWNVQTPLDASSCGEIVPGSFHCPFNNPKYCASRLEVPYRRDFRANQEKIFDPAANLGFVFPGDDIRTKWQIDGVMVQADRLQVVS